MYILSLMDGKHTLNDIYVHLIEKHGKEYTKTIKKDLESLMIRLYKQSIISFKEGAEAEMCNTKQSLSDGYLVKVAFDGQLKAIYQFLHNQAKQCKIQ